MQNKENYLYSVRIETEILANREQEYIRRRKVSDMSVEDYESEFEEYDFYDAKRWIRITVESFCEKTLEEVEKRIKFKFHNCNIDTVPLVEGRYFYWFENNCLVNNERVLHRALVDIQYKSDVEMTEDDMRRIAAKTD